MPRSDPIREVRFDSVVYHDNQERMLLAKIQDLADRQRFIDLEPVFTQILAESRQFAGEVDESRHEQRLALRLPSSRSVIPDARRPRTPSAESPAPLSAFSNERRP